MSDEDNIDQISLMFEAARSLIGGAKIIIASDGIEEHGLVRKPTLPVIVSSALAIEILLKALLAVNGTKMPPGSGHDLEALFSALPECTQTAVMKHQAKFIGVPAQAARNLLREHKDAFLTWRYPYEKGYLESAPAFMFEFALALSEYVLKNIEIERSGNGWIDDG